MSEREVVVPQHPVAETATDDSARSLVLDPPQVRRWLTGSLALLVVAGLVTAGVLRWVDHRHDRDQAGARNAAQVAAASLEKLLSFTPTDVLTSADAEGELLTGKFGKTYVTQLKSDWGPRAVESKITSTAEVVRVAQSSVDGNEVRLLVYANITRTVGGTNETDLITPTMLITMKKVGGSWRISEYEGV